MANEKQIQTKFRTSIGGQALIEGILMRGPGKQAIVVRSPEGLVEKVEELTLVRDKYPILGLPIIRGAVTFIDSLFKGVKALMFSAEYFPEDEAVQPGKFEQWLEKKFGNEKLEKFIIVFAVVLSVLMTLGLFILLPTFIAGFIDPYIDSAAVHNLVESVVKLVIFGGYLLLCSKQKDIQRVFAYHGAEHKTIFCYEQGLELTVENCRKQQRFHPRCGTSFLFVVIVVSILVSSVVFSFVDWRSVWVRVGMHLLLLVPIVGVTYEFNRFVGRHDNAVTRVLAKPGVWLQNFTTNEPDDSMLEVAIRALELVIPDEAGKDKWKKMAVKYNDLYLDIRALLKRRGVEDTTQAAKELVCIAAGKTKNELLRDGLLYVPPEVEREAYSLAERHANGEPVAYLIGEWEFYGLPFDISPAVLIPRPDTEILCENVIRELRGVEPCRILDLCAGSGCVGVAVAKHLENARVTLGEISEDALKVCRQNIRRNDLTGRMSVMRIDAFEKPSRQLGEFQCIVSNPPYIPSGDIDGLDSSVRDHEPRLALDGGEDGLDFYRCISDIWRDALAPGGLLAFEVGIGQADEVLRIMRANGFGDIEVIRDLHMIPRVVYGRLYEEI